MSNASIAIRIRTANEALCELIPTTIRRRPTFNAPLMPPVRRAYVIGKFGVAPKPATIQ